MATELAMAMRKLKAQEALVRQVVDLNRKMDLVMDKLGVTDEVPADSATVEPNADEVPAADATVEPQADEVPAETPAVETKSKKK
jgi:hypothetical protein